MAYGPNKESGLGQFLQKQQQGSPRQEETIDTEERRQRREARAEPVETKGNGSGKEEARCIVERAIDSLGTRAIDIFAEVEQLLSGDRKRERQRFEAAFITYNRCLSAHFHQTSRLRR
jgi:hypothetical protein